MAGTFEIEVSNERLHSTLTAPAFRLVSALGAQIAAALADKADAPAAAASSRRAGGSRRPPPGGPSGSGGSLASAPAAAAGGSGAPIRVMEGVKEDAYRWGTHWE